jgi:membrane protein DedA with SNARE-associated domain
LFLDLSLGVLNSLHGFTVYWVLFLLVAAAGIGGPWSQDILLIAAGNVISPHDLNPALVMLVAWCAVMAGDAFSLWIGRHYGARWVRRPWAARFVPPDRLPGLEQGMRRIELPFAFVTRFLPGQRATLYFIAGALRMRWFAFLVGNGVAALVQVPLFFFGARSLGWSWPALQPGFGRADDLLTLALLVVLVGWWLRARSAGRRAS